MNMPSQMYVPSGDGQNSSIGCTPLRYQPQFTDERVRLCQSGFAGGALPTCRRSPRENAIALLEESGLSYSDALILASATERNANAPPIARTAFEESIHVMRERGMSKLEIAAQLSNLAQRQGRRLTVDGALERIAEVL